MSGQNLDQIFDATVMDSLQEAIGSGITRIIAVYLEDVPINIQDMRQALEQHNFETIGRLAHSLKSSSGNLGARQVSNLALALEQSINQGQTEEKTLATAIDQIDQALTQIKPLLLHYTA
jgi:HPt (histidine-containing phosphotransfer) domain-containing protein